MKMKKKIFFIVMLVAMSILPSLTYGKATFIAALDGSKSYGFYFPIADTDIELGVGGSFAANKQQTTLKGWCALVAFGFELDMNVVDNRVTSFSLMKGISHNLSDNTKLVLSIGLLDISTDSPVTATILPFCTPYLTMDINI
jgi:hypothetical protein